MATTHPPQLRVIPGELSEPGRRTGALPDGVLDGHGDARAGSRRWRSAEGMLAGYCAVAAATAAGVAAGGTRHPLVALAVLGLAVLAVTTRLTLPAALVTVVTGWLCYDGFIIGRHADLGWDGTREAWWLLVLVAAAGCGAAVGHARRRGRRGHA